jgi:hypothetical protein
VTEALASKQAESWVSRWQNVYLPRWQNVCLPNLNNEEDARAAASDNDQEA